MTSPPRFCTTAPPDKHPISAHRLGAWLLRRPKRKPASNKSPAPVVSTTLDTVQAGCANVSIPFFFTRHPFSPRVSATVSTYLPTCCRKGSKSSL
eukprot:scaffold31_cov334-Pavlova_lutheri.AAC.51